MKAADFDYDLPPDLIAQAPAEQRDGSRMMVLHRAALTLEQASEVRELRPPVD